MPVLSSIFLVAALVLAVVLGPQTRPWVWGPSMVALGVAVVAAIPALWRRGKAPADLGVIALGAVTAGWFAWRAWTSPVGELGQADLLLAGGAVAAFVCIRAIAGHALAERILTWGIALLLLANLVVIFQQIQDPPFAPVFRSRVAIWPSGFYAHYNEAANYLIASSLLVGAAALFGRHARVTRLLWCLIAIAGLAGVWFTRSRGGILGAAVGCGVFAVVALVLAKRRGSRWFAPALITIPLIGLLIGTFLLMGWQNAQQSRHAGAGIDQLLDNDLRLYFLGIALSCIGLHPLAGGGSRSFSWECYRFWEQRAQGVGGSRPDMVHNEWVQSATDYGLLGSGLLVGLIGALVLAAILRLLFEETPESRDSSDSWRLGALAGLAGMMVQSCFSFVFHLMPGILLLGICLGQMSRSKVQPSGAQSIGTRILLTVAAIACAVLLLPTGWVGSQVTRILWPTYFSKQGPFSSEARTDALGDALQLWPQPSLYQDRALVFQQLAGSNEGAGFREPAERAIDDYQEASRLHPYDPGLAVNRANLLSALRRDSEAEEEYARTIQLQGGMEPGFRGRFALAVHLLHKGLRQYAADQPAPALEALENAARLVEDAVKLTPPYIINIDGGNARLAIHENLGITREALGDRTGALQAYDFAAALPNGIHCHYRAGVLLGKIAVDEWSKRQPSAALGHFMDARKRVIQGCGENPQDVTASQRAAYIAYLDRMIAFLTGAKIAPPK
jgi:tetratricopeptide (TPR) repeat protein